MAYFIYDGKQADNRLNGKRQPSPIYTKDLFKFQAFSLKSSKIYEHCLVMVEFKN